MSPKSELTRTQCSNLDRLATYLEGLPAAYKHFCMATYIKGGDQETLDNNESSYVEYALRNGGVDQHGCGTAACAIGHGPAAGIFMREVELFGVTYWDSETEKWINYEEPNWGIYSEQFAPLYTELWEWVFGAEWTDVDNSHQGAAARIRYILDRQDFPEGFDRFCNPTEEMVAAYAPYLKQPA